MLVIELLYKPLQKRVKRSTQSEEEENVEISSWHMVDQGHLNMYSARSAGRGYAAVAMLHSYDTCGRGGVGGE